MMNYPTTAPTMYPPVVRTVNECAGMCERAITMCLGMPDVQTRGMQIQLLRDCATICQTTACFIARISGFSKMVANLCACICQACANECAKYPDVESQNCARMCQYCAQECQKYAMM